MGPNKLTAQIEQTDRMDPNKLTEWTRSKGPNGPEKTQTKGPNGPEQTDRMDQNRGPNGPEKTQTKGPNGPEQTDRTDRTNGPNGHGYGPEQRDRMGPNKLTAQIEQTDRIFFRSGSFGLMLENWRRTTAMVLRFGP